MIQVTKIETLEDLSKMEFSAYSFMELEDKLFDVPLLEHLSSVMYKATLNNSPIMFLGIISTNFLSKPPEVWILTSKTLERNPILLKQFAKLFKLFLLKYPRLMIRVDKAFESGQSFAKFFRFKETYKDGKYIIYEVKQ